MSDKLWACFNKTCPCLPFRGESKPPFGYYSYDDDDNLEFENLLAGQDSESIAAFLTRAPFASSQGYRRVTNMVTPNEEASASTGRLLDDEDNLQTQDAQFLPDEQINKFTEQFIGEQVKYNQDNDEQLAQLAAEEEEVERLEEEEYERKRRAAAEAALAKGFITPDQAAAKNKNTYFTIDDDDGDDGQVTDSSRTIYSNGGSSVELSTTTSQRNAIEEQNTSLNKPRNPHERFVANDINEDDYDYDNVTDFEESSNYDRRPSNSLFGRRYSRRSILRDNESKMEDYSPFSVSILRSDDYEISHEDYSPTVGDEEIDHPFANILPDFSERLGSFFNGLTNSMIIKGKNKFINKDEGNKEIINHNNNQEINNLNGLDANNNTSNKKKMVTFTVEPESSTEPSSPISHGFTFGSGSGRRGLRKLVSGLSNSSRSSSTEVNG